MAESSKPSLQNVQTTYDGTDSPFGKSLYYTSGGVVLADNGISVGQPVDEYSLIWKAPEQSYRGTYDQYIGIYGEENTFKVIYFNEDDGSYYQHTFDKIEGHDAYLASHSITVNDVQDNERLSIEELYSYEVADNYDYNNDDTIGAYQSGPEDGTHNHYFIVGDNEHNNIQINYSHFHPDEHSLNEHDHYYEHSHSEGVAVKEHGHQYLHSHENSDSEYSSDSGRWAEHEHVPNVHVYDPAHGEHQNNAYLDGNADDYHHHTMQVANKEIHYSMMNLHPESETEHDHPYEQINPSVTEDGGGHSEGSGHGSHEGGESSGHDYGNGHGSSVSIASVLHDGSDGPYKQSIYYLTNHKIVISRKNGLNPGADQPKKYKEMHDTQNNTYPLYDEVRGIFKNRKSGFSVVTINAEGEYIHLPFKWNKQGHAKHKGGMKNINDRRLIKWEINKGIDFSGDGNLGSIGSVLTVNSVLYDNSGASQGEGEAIYYLSDHSIVISEETGLSSGERIGQMKKLQNPEGKTYGLYDQVGGLFNTRKGFTIVTCDPDGAYKSHPFTWMGDDSAQLKAEPKGLRKGKLKRWEMKNDMDLSGDGMIGKVKKVKDYGNSEGSDYGGHEGGESGHDYGQGHGEGTDHGGHEGGESGHDYGQGHGEGTDHGGHEGMESGHDYENAHGEGSEHSGHEGMESGHDYGSGHGDGSDHGGHEGMETGHDYSHGHGDGSDHGGDEGGESDSGSGSPSLTNYQVTWDGSDSPIGSKIYYTQAGLVLSPQIVPPMGAIETYTSFATQAASDGDNIISNYHGSRSDTIIGVIHSNEAGIDSYSIISQSNEDPNSYSEYNFVIDPAGDDGTALGNPDGPSTYDISSLHQQETSDNYDYDNNGSIGAI